MNFASRFVIAFAISVLPAIGEESSAILGYAEPFKTITISSGEPGVIAEMLVEEGARVKKTQVLARLDIATLQADLEIAKAEAKLQTTRLKRLEELSAANRSTPEELERARTDLPSRTRKREESKRRSRCAACVRPWMDRHQNQTRSQRSGLCGQSTRAHRRSGGQTHRHSLPPPYRTATLSPGATVNLQLLDEHVTASAKVEFVSPVTDSTSGTMRVKFVIKNANGAHRSGERCTLAE